MSVSLKGLLRAWEKTTALMLVGALALPLIVVEPARAESARSLYNKGKDAEARQDYEKAYENFKAAYDQKPKELKYRSAFERNRFLASASHVHRGQMLRDAGRLEDALAEFEKATAIDGSSFIAQQEIRRTREMIQAAQQPPPEEQPQEKNPLKKRVEEAEGPVELVPISDQPITLKLTEDSRVIYETIGKLAGVNVLFDPDYTSRRVRIELNGVTLQEALEVVAFESKTFWRPVTSNTIFIAADTNAKRKELEQNVLKTFYLSNVSQPTDLQDVVNALRTILEINRIQQLPSQSAIVMRGTPDQIALAEKLIGDIDKAKPEVVVDVAVIQVRRDKLRDLGINPPTTATLSFQPSQFGQPATTTTGTGTTTPTTSGNSLTINSFKHLDSTSYAVNIGAATISALFSDSATKIIQNPQIRALDGQKASLKIGDRVPVATGSFQPGFTGTTGVGGVSPLVNTQFQYIDVGVNIDVTPKIHATREVTLKIMLDISSVTSRVNIGGIDQPVIGQRKIEHEIRLKEGEVNLLGGIFEDQDVKSISGYPFLAQIPFFRYFFSTEHKEKVENEIVFMLVPHIVRGQDLTALNQRALDVGSATAVELRRRGTPAQQQPKSQAAPNPLQQQPPAPQPAPQAQLNPAAPPQLAGAPPPAQAQQNESPPLAGNTGTAPPGQRTPAQPASPASAAMKGLNQVRFDPPTVTVKAGTSFTVNLVLNAKDALSSFSTQLQYDPSTLQVVNVSNGGFLARDGQPVAVVHRDDTDAGRLQISGTRPPDAGSINGEGAVFTLTFTAKKAAETRITPAGLFARDASNQQVPMTANQLVIHVQ